MGAASYTPAQIQAMITSAAQQYGVDPSLALAIAKTESNFNPAAVNTSNPNGTADYGVMQINSSNLSSLGLTSSSALDPQSNINAAMQLLAGYTQQYGGNPTLIAAAYNGGPGAVSAGNTSTSYVASVLGNMTQFGGSVSAPSLSDLLTGSSDTTDTTDLTDSGTFDPTVLIYAGLGILGAVVIAELV